MRERPTNTTKDETGPWTMGRNPAAILAQEARGQQELCESEALPVDCKPELEAALVGAGVVFGEPFTDDPIFRPVTLPEGWSKRPAEGGGDYISELLNADGKVMARVFYKAAFYDRRADMYAE